MGIAEGIALGEKSNQNLYGMQSTMNLASAGANLGGAINAVRGRGRLGRVSPQNIWDNAAFLANEEKKRDLEERKVALAEQAEYNRQDNIKAARHRQKLQDIEAKGKGIEETYQKQMGGAQDRYSKDIEMIQKGEVFERGMEKDRRKDDFNVAKWGLANQDARPIMEYINNYGDASVNVDDIQFGPEGDIIVYSEGNPKGAYFESSEEFYKTFMGFMDPEVQTKLAEEERKEREQTRKEKKTDYDVSGKGDKKLTAKEAADTRLKLKKEYRETFQDVGGELKSDAPNEDEWVNQEMGKLGVSAPSGEKAIPEEGEAPEGEKPPVEGARKAPDGKWYIESGGKRFLVHEGGISGEAGEKVTGAIPERPKRTQKGRRSARQRLDEEKRARKEARKGGRKVKRSGSATYKDPKTGHIVRATYMSDGSVDREIIKKSKKKKDKDKKKKKKDSDNGD